MEELDLSVALLTATVVIVPAVFAFGWGWFTSFAKASTNTVDDKIVELVEKLNLVAKAQEKTIKVLEKKIEEKKAKK